MNKNLMKLVGLMLLLILCGFYKTLIGVVAPDLSVYTAKLLEEGLQLVTVGAFAAGVGYFAQRRQQSGLNNKAYYWLVPVAVISFMPMFFGAQERTGSEWLALVLIVACIGVTEELACRGLMYSFIESKGKAAAIIGSSLLFAALHLMNFFKGASLEDTLIQMVFAAGFGLVMAAVRSRTTSLLPLMAVHALWDFNSKGSVHEVSDTAAIAIYLAMLAVVLWGCWLTYRELGRSASSERV